MPSDPFLLRARRIFSLLSLALAFVGAALALQAQIAPATGAIEGRVFHPASGNYVDGARITVEGTPLETFTDDDGSFSLEGVPAGAARVRIFYTGAGESRTTKAERGQALGFGVIEIGGTGSATVFQAISTTTLLELVAPSARQWPCAIGKSPSGTFPLTANAGNTLSAGRPLMDRES